MWCLSLGLGLISRILSGGRPAHQRLSLIGLCNRQVGYVGNGRNWLWHLARSRVIIAASVFAMVSCQSCFKPRSQTFFSSGSEFR